MVTTKHCCYGVCRSDSRYSDRNHMKGVFFIPFPKPTRDLEKCKRWIASCRRENFGPDNVSKDTYICSLHFIGGNGPTVLNPDPIQAEFTPEQVDKISRKRKATKPRIRNTNSKCIKQSQFDTDDAAEALIQLSGLPTTSNISQSDFSSQSVQDIQQSQQSSNQDVKDENARTDNSQPV